MLAKTKILLSAAGLDKPGQYFSVYLKQEIRQEQDEFQQPKHIIAISCFMNNFQGLCKLLFMNKIIDKYLNWNYGDGHLVLIGDQLRPESQLIDCLWFVYSLEEKARKKGGCVHFIIGDYEKSKLDGDWSYLHPQYAKKQPGSKSPTTALYYGNRELLHWLYVKNGFVKLGNILFMHNNMLTGLNTIGSSSLPFSEDEQLKDTLTKFNAGIIVTTMDVAESLTGSHFNGKLVIVGMDTLLIKRKYFYRVTADRQRKRIK